MGYEEAISSEVERWKGASVRYEIGGKHMRAIIKYRDKEQFVTYPATGSDGRRGALNCLADVKRTLTQLGARRDVPAKASRPKRVINPGADQRETIIIEKAPIRPDPWAALHSATFPAPTAAELVSRWRRMMNWLSFWRSQPLSEKRP